MQSVMEKNMVKKRISVSGKRQITIPIEFYSQLGIDKEVECYVRNGSLIVRPATIESGGEFAEQILADLIAQGLQGNELMERFKKLNRSIRPAVEAMILQADDIATEKTASATMSDIFGEGE